MRPGGVTYTLINICYSDMLTSAPCLHVGTKSEFQKEAGRWVHYPQGKSMSISYLKSCGLLQLLSGLLQLFCNL